MRSSYYTSHGIWVPNPQPYITRTFECLERLYPGTKFDLVDLFLCGMGRYCSNCWYDYPPAGIKGECKLIRAFVMQPYPEKRTFEDRWLFATSPNPDDVPFEHQIYLCRDLDSCEFRAAVRT